jgi:hypothetical protein
MKAIMFNLLKWMTSRDSYGMNYVQSLWRFRARYYGFDKLFLKEHTFSMLTAKCEIFAFSSSFSVKFVRLGYI